MIVTAAALLFTKSPCCDILPGEEENSLEESPILTIVSKTEYVPGDEGQVIASLRDKNFSNIVNASCDAVTLYPNKSVFFTQSMVLNQIGNYFVNFTVPRLDGVYEYEVNCSWNGRDVASSSSFHVSKGRMKAWIEK
jgi:hypothetical protein